MYSASPAAVGSAGAPVANRHAESAELWTLAACVVAAFYLGTSLYIAAHRLLWYDEILTVRIAALPHLSTIFDALRRGADGMAPGYYVLATAAQRLVGSSNLAARLLSAMAVAAGLLITFDCARRLTDGLHGLIALAVLTCSFLPYYGYEARSYAIYFMLAALSLWIWACTGSNKFSAMAFGTVLFLAVTIHYYAVLLLVPYGLWELHGWRPWQPPSPKLTAGVLGAALAVALSANLMFSYSRQISRDFWAPPSLPAFRAIFSELFPDGLFLLALIVIWIVVTAGQRSTDADGPGAAESVGWLFLAIPVAGFVLAKWKTNAFISRYFISALPGIAVAFSCLLWRHLRTPPPPHFRGGSRHLDDLGPVCSTGNCDQPCLG